jgi:hypothetical protein
VVKRVDSDKWLVVSKIRAEPPVKVNRERRTQKRITQRPLSGRLPNQKNRIAPFPPIGVERDCFIVAHCCSFSSITTPMGSTQVSLGSALSSNVCLPTDTNIVLQEQALPQTLSHSA